MKKELLLAAMGISALTPGCVNTGGDGISSASPQFNWALSSKNVDIDKLLKNVAEKPVPTNLNQGAGAMCYVIKGPPLRTEYVCPICGTKMIYVMNRIEALNAPVNSVKRYRNYIEQLNKLGLAARLDESFLCGKCNTEEKSGFFLELKFKDRVVWNVLLGETDLRKLIAFVQGDLVWQGGPLKPELPRIRQLLGVKE